MKSIWWGAATAGWVWAASKAWQALQRATDRSGDQPLPPARHRGGSGTPLLLLHGVGGNWTAWKPVLPLLESRHDVLAPSLLGHGGAVPLGPGVEPTLDALVDGVEAELDRAGVETAHIVGNSLGGWIAIELARRGRARSLVLLSPAGASTSPRMMAAVAMSLRLSIAGLSRLVRYADLIAANRLLRTALMGMQVARPELIEAHTLAGDIRASGQAPAVGPLLRLLPTLELAPLPAKRSYPIRLVWGTRDRIIPYAHFGAPMLDRLPDAELVNGNGLGHVPMSDDPEQVSELILQVTLAVDRYDDALAEAAR